MAEFSLEQDMKAQRESRGQLYFFFNLDVDGSGWSASNPATLLTGKRLIF
jgi:hypothetical protein